MANGLAAYSYNSEGRLVQIVFPGGAAVSYDYDEAGNRTTVVEIPAALPSTYAPPTVSELPTVQQGDFANPAMIVMLSTGELVGWGDNTCGVLANANSTVTAYYNPAQRVLFDPNTTMPPYTATIVQWVFTNANLYVVFSNGWVYSCGRNDYGQLGQGDTTARAQLKRIEYFVTNSHNITQVWAAGNANATLGGGCVYFYASDNYTVYACGANAVGNLAIGNTTNQDTPVACTGVTFSSTKYVTDVQILGTGGIFSVYMLFNDGTLYCSGFNGSAQLSNNTYTNLDTLTAAQLSTGGTVNFTSVYVNGGYNGSTASGNALAIDSSGYLWGVGYNANNELGQPTTATVTKFTKLTSSYLAGNVVTAGIGGGIVGYSYAITTAGTMYTFGYNGQNNLFQGNSTTPATPAQATFLPGTAAQAFFPKGNVLGANSQLIVLTTSGILVYAGVANGQQSIANTVHAGDYFYVPAPRQFLDGSATISNVFVHGTGTTQRWFILSSTGLLYASGSNAGSVCTGGLSSNSIPLSVSWSEISFTY